MDRGCLRGCGNMALPGLDYCRMCLREYPAPGSYRQCVKCIRNPALLGSDYCRDCVKLPPWQRSHPIKKCTRCGFRPPIDGKRCLSCLLHDAAKNQKKRKRKKGWHLF